MSRLVFVQRLFVAGLMCVVPVVAFAAVLTDATKTTTGTTDTSTVIHPTLASTSSAQTTTTDTTAGTSGTTTDTAHATDTTTGTATATDKTKTTTATTNANTSSTNTTDSTTESTATAPAPTSTVPTGTTTEPPPTTTTAEPHPAPLTDQSATRILSTTTETRPVLTTQNTPTTSAAAPVPTTSVSSAPAVRSTVPARVIEDMSVPVREVETAKKVIQQKVNTAVTQRVEKAVESALTPESATLDDRAVRAFDPVAREKLLEKFSPALSREQDTLNTKVGDVLLNSSAPVRTTSDTIRELQPVLKSSLSDIEKIITYETGNQVDLSHDTRTVTAQIIEDTARFEAAKRELARRGGLGLYTDTDNDGVSDYDEERVYMTNPNNAFSSGSVLTDGERILLGLDVHSTSSVRVPVESPLVSTVATSSVYSVTSIELTRTPTATLETASSSTSTTPRIVSEKITFEGQALPNSFVTLYIFSTPIVVTVKADRDGVWHYSLDKELENGQHEVYVATVDNAGKIIARSPAIPFVKTAEAVSYTPSLAASTPGQSMADLFRSYLLLAAMFAVSVFVLGVLVRLGRGPISGNRATTPVTEIENSMQNSNNTPQSS